MKSRTEKWVWLVRVVCLLSIVSGQPIFPQQPEATDPSTPSEQEPGSDAQPEGERNIRFQFQGVPYRDVIERFAQMTGKPILGEVKLDGTLTFSDPRPYNYTEALDTLNVILSMNGFVLVESDRYLRLAPRSELPQLPLKIFRGISEAKNVRPGEMVTVVLPLKFSDATETAEAAKHLLSGAGMISPLAKGRGIVVTDRFDAAQRIQSLLVELDVESEKERDMRIFRLVNASGNVLAEMISRTFGEASAPREARFAQNQWHIAPPNPEDYVSVTLDEATRTLVVVGPAEQIGLAAELVQRFERDSASAGQMRIFYTKKIPPIELANMIREAVPGVAPAGAIGDVTNKARLIADQGRRRLIVTAPVAQQLAAIEEFIRRVDQGVAGGASEDSLVTGERLELTRIFRCENVDAQKIARVIEQATTSRGLDGSAVARLRVTFEASTSSVIVTGAPGDVQTAERIHTQLDVDPVGRSKPRELRAVSPKEKSPEELRSLLEPVLRDERRERGPRAGPMPRLVADPAGGRLLVFATPEEHERIERLVEELDTGGGQVDVVTRSVALKGRDGAKILPLVTQLYESQLQGRARPDRGAARILAAPDGRRLLITGSVDEIARVEAIIAQLDRDSAARAARRTQPIDVEGRSAERLVPLVTRLYGEQVRGQPELEEGPPSLTPAGEGRRILVTGTDAQIERVTAIIRQLEGERVEKEPRTTRAIEVYGAAVEPLIRLVERLYRAQLEGVEIPEGAPATIVADDSNEQVLVTGTQAEIDRVDAIVRQLNPLAKRRARRETRVLRLQTAQATEIEGLLKNTLNADPQRPTVQILVDERSNSLIVTGPGGSLNTASEVVAGLDTAPNRAPRELRVVGIRVGEANAAAALTKELLIEAMRIEKGAGYRVQAKIVADDQTNRLIITAPADELEKITPIVDDLNRVSVKEEDTRIFKLRRAQAVDLAATLSDAMTRYDRRGREIRLVRIAAAEESNSLIVSGPTDEIEAIRVLVEQVDSDLPQEPAELRVVPLKGNDGVRVAEVVTGVWEQRGRGRDQADRVSITSDPGGRRLLVVAPGKLMPEVLEVITAVDGQDAPPRNLHVIELRARRANVLLPVVREAFQAQNFGRSGEVRINADPSGDRLVVTATDDELERIKEMVAQLDQVDEEKRETRFFEFNDPSELQRSVNLVERLYRQELRSSPGTLQESADAQFLTDPTTARLIVTARSSHVDRIAGIVDRLGSASAGRTIARETRVLHFEDSRSLERVAPLVDRLYDAQLAGRPAPVGGRVSVVADRRGRRLLVTGSKDEVDRVAALVAQLEIDGGLKREVRETRTIELVSRTANAVLPLVRQLYDAQLAGSDVDVSGGKASIVADTDPTSAGKERLLVTGSASEIARVEGIVRQLEVSSPVTTTRTLRVARTYSYDANELVPLARSLYEAELRRQPEPSGGRATIAEGVDPTQVLITGPAQQIARVEGIIRQLDPVDESRAERQTQVFRLKTANANEVRGLVDKSINTTPGRPNIRVEVDQPSNSLIVTGPQGAVETAASIVRELDQSSTREPRELRVVELKSGNATAVAPLVTEMVTETLRSMRGASYNVRAKILADESVNRLVITAPASEMSVIAPIVDQINQVQLKKEDTRIFELESANAENVAGLLQEAMTSFDQRGRPTTRVRVAADARTNSLIVSGPTMDLEVAESFIRQLDEGGAMSAPALRVVELVGTNGKELAPLVEDLWRQQTKGRKDSGRVTVSDEPSGRRLVIVAPESQVDEVVRLTREIDGQGGDAGRSLRVIELKERQAGELAPLVIAGYQAKYPTSHDDVTIRADAGGNRLIVLAPKERLSAIEEIVGELDTVGERAARKLQLIELENNQPARLAGIVERLYRDQRGGRAATATITPDASESRLVVLATPEDLELIKEIVATLEDKDSTSGRQTRFFAVGRQRDVSHVQRLVEQLYREEFRSTGRPDLADARFIPDAESGRLIVTARGEQMERIAELIDSVQSDATPLDRETRVYDLSTATATDLARTVAQLYREQMRGQPGDLSDDVLVLADATTNRLIITAPSAAMPALETIIKRLDEVTTQTASTRVYQLRNASATQIASILSGALVRRSGRREIPLVSVGSDEKTNTLIVSGEPKHLQSAAVIIEQLDAARQRDPRLLRTFELPEGDAEEIAKRVKELYENHIVADPEAGSADAFILGEPTTSRLVVTASERHMQVIEQIMSQFGGGRGGPDGRQVEVMVLKRGSSAAVAAVLTQLYAREIASERTEDRVVVSASPDDRTVVVNARRSTLDEIRRLVNEIDGQAETSDLQVRTYRIEGNAAEVAPTLQRLFTDGKTNETTTGLEPRFEADPSTGTLMIAATTDQFERIEVLIKSLQAAATVTTHTRTFVLRQGDATQLASILASMLGADGVATSRSGRGPSGGGAQDVRVSAAPALNAIVVQAPSEKMILAQEIVKSLDSLGSGGQSVLQVVKLKRAQAGALAPSLTSAMRARGLNAGPRPVTVTAETNSNSLLISGPADAVKEVQKIIEELDEESTGGTLDVRVYKMKNGQADEVSSTLSSIVNQIFGAQVQRNPGATRPPLTVAPIRRTNSLLVYTTTPNFQLVESLLQSLDEAPEESDREVRFLRLENIPAQQTERQVNLVFATRPAAERPVIQADPLSNSLTIIARDADLTIITDVVTKLESSALAKEIQTRVVPLSQIIAQEMAGLIQGIYSQVSGRDVVITDRIPSSPRLRPLRPSALLPRKPGVSEIDGGEPPLPNSPRSPPRARLPPAQRSGEPKKGEEEQGSQSEDGARGTSAPNDDGDGEERDTEGRTQVVGREEGAIDDGKIYVGVDAGSNSLLLSGPRDELDRIEALIDDLMLRYVEGEAEFRLFQIRVADPVSIARTLDNLFNDKDPLSIDERGNRTYSPPSISVVTDQRSRTIIVRAKPKDFVVIESLIDQFDRAGIEQLAFRRIRLNHGEPDAIMVMVQRFIDQFKGVRPAEPITAFADPRTRSILVAARPDVFEEIETMIEVADSASPHVGVDVAFVPLKKANADALASVLQRMLRPSPSGSVTPEALTLQDQVRRLRIRNESGGIVELDLTAPIKVEADAPSGNRLILMSTPENLRALTVVAEMMDTVPIVEGVTVRLVRLEHADAATVAQTIRDVFQQGLRLGASRGGQGQGEPEGEEGKALVNPVNLSVDRRTNTLVISGHDASVALALGVIEDMDQDVERFVTEVRLFRLKHASPARLLPMLRSVFSESGPSPGAEGISTQVTRLRTVLPQLQSRTTDLPKTRSALVVQADETTSTLIVAARSDSMPLIADVIQTVDVPAASGLNSVRIYPLDHADPRAIRDLVNTMQSGPRAATLRPEDRASISIDPRTNALIVAGNDTAFALVDSLVSQLDKEADAGVILAAIPLKHNDAQVVSAMVRQLFNQRRQSLAIPGTPLQPSTRVDVNFDRLTNSLIVSATKENTEVIRELLATIDSAPTPEGGVLEVFTLKHADAQRAASMLRSLVRQGLYRPGASGRGGGGNNRERLAIALDQRSNSLIVSASPENLVVLKELVEEIDSEAYTASGSVRLFPLKHASASRLAPTLQRFFNSRRAAEGAVGDPAGLVPVNVIADSRTNSLIVAGSRESFGALERMIEQLDVAEIEGEYTFRVFPLERTTATNLRGTLQQLLQRRPRRPGEPPPQPITVVADSWANALIVVALPEDLEVVESLVAKLDSMPPAPESNIHVIPLEKAGAESVARTIQSLYRGGFGSGGNSVATVSVDERLNALVVSAGEADYKRIAELVKRLDTDLVAKVREIRVFPLVHAGSVDLARILNQALNRRVATGSGGTAQSLLQFVTRAEGGQEVVATALQEGVLITPDVRTNALVVSAPVDSLPLLEQVISNLDTSSPRVSRIRVFDLQNADARQMAIILSELFRLESSGRASDERPVRYRMVPSEERTVDDQEVEGGRTEIATEGVAMTSDSVDGKAGEAPLLSADEVTLNVSVDARTNSLVVAGTEHYVDMVGDVVAELDASPAREQTTRVYRLRNARANEIQDALVSFLEQRRRRLTEALGPEGLGSAQRLLDDDVALVGEPSSNTLLVSASARSFRQINDIIEELDRPQPQVLIQALIAEVTLDRTTELGVEWNVMADVDGRPVTAQSDFGLVDQFDQLGGLATSVTAGDVNFFLRALQVDGRLEILSRPQVLAVDNQQATITIGQEVPQVTGAVTTELGNINSVVEYRDTGVSLKVTPRINPDGFVTMDVEPEISSLSSSGVDTGQGGELPIFNTRKATTTVSVQDGHTIIIGGLISTTDDERDEKIPFLGDIPFLGVAFQSRTVATRRTELLIILTPHVISGVDDADETTKDNIRQSRIHGRDARDEVQQRLLDELDLGVDYDESGPEWPDEPAKPLSRQRANELEESEAGAEREPKDGSEGDRGASTENKGETSDDEEEVAPPLPEKAADWQEPAAQARRFLPRHERTLAAT